MQVVEEKAQRTPGKKSLAIEAYARALRAIPGTICDNAGIYAHTLLLTIMKQCWNSHMLQDVADLQTTVVE